MSDIKRDLISNKIDMREMIEVYRNGITSRVVDTGYIELDDDQET